MEKVIHVLQIFILHLNLHLNNLWNLYKLNCTITLLQQEAADCLCRLLKKCLDKNPSPNSKVLKNLCTFLCVDPTFTPKAASPIPSYSGNSDSRMLWSAVGDQRCSREMNVWRILIVNKEYCPGSKGDKLCLWIPCL